MSVNEPDPQPSLSASSSSSRKTLFTRLSEWVPPLWLEKIVVSVTTPLLIWAVVFLLVGQDGLPGGQVFALVVILFFGIATGYALELCKLPPLLGMLLVGIALRNVPGFQFGKDLRNEVTSPLRQIALAVILIRAGLGLDPAALAKLSTVVIRLAFGPCLVEAVTIGVASHFILGFPWGWGFLLGFVLAAVSPAVTVPCLLNLRDRGFGVAKGIPTIVIAAASMDDILAISAFGVTLGVTLSQQEESLAMTIMQGPIELVLGISFGIVWGLGLGLFLGRKSDDATLTVIKLVFILAGGLLAIFGFQFVNFPGSGALGCLTSAFVAAIVWRRKGVLDDNDSLNWAFQLLWFIFQPLLFGLIGCEIDFSTLDPNVVLLGLTCLCIGLSTRILTSFYMVAGAGLTIKERLFISIAWLPKATVQAAIGPVAYDLARQLSAGPSAEKLGLEVLTIAVLSILITAPVGAIGIMLAGPKLLSVGDGCDPSQGQDCELLGERKTLTSTDLDETTNADQSYLEDDVVPKKGKLNGAGDEVERKKGS